MAKNLLDVQNAEVQKHSIKVAFFDVDGTLLRKDGSFTKATAQQIRRLQSLGVKTAAATGLPHYATEFLQKELGLSDMGVFCTGAHVYQPSSQKMLSCASIPSDLAADFLAHVRACDVYYELYTNAQYGVDHNRAEGVMSEHAHHLRCTPNRSGLDEWVASHNVHKFLVGEDTSKGGDMLNALEARYPSLTFAYAMFPAYPTWRFASVVSKQACKQDAFSRLLEFYQVEPDQVAAFGDSQSDMVFLRSAGVGVAMGNASDHVKAVARYITHHVEEDGVAYALSRLV